MNIDSGTAIVLVYVLVSMGVITASLVAALATGWFTDRLRERRSRQAVPGGENAERGRDRSGAAKLNESLLVRRVFASHYDQLLFSRSLRACSTNRTPTLGSIISSARASFIGST